MLLLHRQSILPPMHRRHFLRGLSALLVAPAIVRAATLMSVKPLWVPPYYDWHSYIVVQGLGANHIEFFRGVERAAGFSGTFA